MAATLAHESPIWATGIVLVLQASAAGILAAMLRLTDSAFGRYWVRGQRFSLTERWAAFHSRAWFGPLEWLASEVAVVWILSALALSCFLFPMLHRRGPAAPTMRLGLSIVAASGTFPMLLSVMLLILIYVSRYLLLGFGDEQNLYLANLMAVGVVAYV